MSFLDHGEDERFKGAAHAALLVLAAGCAGYNLAALCKRPRFHLFVNAILYGTLVGYEVATVRHHWTEDE